MQNTDPLIFVVIDIGNLDDPVYPPQNYVATQLMAAFLEQRLMGRAKIHRCGGTFNKSAYAFATDKPEECATVIRKSLEALPVCLLVVTTIMFVDESKGQMRCLFPPPGDPKHIEHVSPDAFGKCIAQIWLDSPLIGKG